MSSDYLSIYLKDYIIFYEKGLKEKLSLSFVSEIRITELILYECIRLSRLFDGTAPSTLSCK